MVKLRSTRQDRTLLIAVWVLTVIVLVLGGLAVSPILLVWGVVGLLAAIYLTRVHIRDTRAPRQGLGDGSAPNASEGDEADAADAAGAAAPSGQQAPGGAAKTDTSEDVEETR